MRVVQPPRRAPPAPWSSASGSAPRCRAGQGAAPRRRRHRGRPCRAAVGVEVSGVDDMGGVKYAYFSDPDGNSWALQEIPGRRGRRFEHADLSGARFEHADLTGADVPVGRPDRRGVPFVDIKQVRCAGSRSATSTSPARSLDVTINGVDIAPLVEAELDRRDPERAKMRPTDAGRVPRGLGRQRAAVGHERSSGRDGYRPSSSTSRSTGSGRSSRRCATSRSPPTLGAPRHPRRPGACTRSSCRGTRCPTPRAPRGPSGAPDPRRGARPATRPDGDRARVVDELTDESLGGRDQASRCTGLATRPELSRWASASSSCSTRSRSTASTPSVTSRCSSSGPAARRALSGRSRAAPAGATSSRSS